MPGASSVVRLAVVFAPWHKLDASSCMATWRLEIPPSTFWTSLSRIAIPRGRDCCKLLSPMPKTRSSRISKTDSLVYERQAAMCKALAHPSRIQLLDLVGKGERACGDLQKQLGISKANLSQHVSQLRQAGMIVTRRQGKQMFCSIALPEVKEACQMIRNVLKLQLRNTNRLLT
jgi:DNA-binding transcriptional ArsR family regulator